jgi:hypothetical protein
MPPTFRQSQLSAETMELDKHVPIAKIAKVATQRPHRLNRLLMRKLLENKKAEKKNFANAWTKRN